MNDVPPIQSLVPHAGAMCLLDAVLRWDRDRIICTATSHLRPDNPLRHQGRLAPHAGIEYAAQAMAAHAALLDGGDGPPPTAYLAVVSRLDWSVVTLDAAGGSLEVTAWRITDLADSQCYGFALAARGEKLIWGEAIVVRPRVEVSVQ